MLCTQALIAGLALLRRWGLPFVPMPASVHFVIGKEIDFGPPNASPTDEQVEAVLRAYDAWPTQRAAPPHLRRASPNHASTRGTVGT